MKRVMLFVLTNIAVLALLQLVMFALQAFFGIQIGANGPGLLIMAAVFGMGGSFISLLMSKWIAKRSTGAKVIVEPQTEIERWLVDTVSRQATAAGIGKPEIAVYDAPEINAFATGWNRNNALVAVSTGLLRSMSRDEAEAVLGHEISHVGNGDMVTMALLQGVLNTFVIVAARLIGSVVDSWLSGGRERGGGIGYFITVMALQFLFGIFASMIVMAFSRHREFRADHGGATLATKQKMVAALKRLAEGHGESTLPTQIAAFGIRGGSQVGGFKRLFLTHPPLAERIAALEAA